MTYATLMVHLELGKSNAGLLKVAAGLAGRFGAAVTGIVACQPIQVAYGEAYFPEELEGQDRTQKAEEMAAAEKEFHAALSPATHRLEWRAEITTEGLCDHYARAARSADLILTHMDSARLLDGTRHFNMGDLVMRAGRPVMIVPPEAERLDLDHVLIGWKDTREARRAVADALPLLGAARRVTVAEIAPESRLPETREALADLVAWLARHDITAEALAVPATGPDAFGLARLADDQGANLIVAGAYGHSRLREWVLGGVTLDLLLGTPRFALLSH